MQMLSDSLVYSYCLSVNSTAYLRFLLFLQGTSLEVLMLLSLVFKSNWCRWDLDYSNPWSIFALFVM